LSNFCVGISIVHYPNVEYVELLLSNHTTGHSFRTFYSTFLDKLANQFQ